MAPWLGMPKVMFAEEYNNSDRKILTNSSQPDVAWTNSLQFNSLSMIEREKQVVMGHPMVAIQGVGHGEISSWECSNTNGMGLDQSCALEAAESWVPICLNLRFCQIGLKQPRIVLDCVHLEQSVAVSKEGKQQQQDCYNQRSGDWGARLNTRLKEAFVFTRTKPCLVPPLRVSQRLCTIRHSRSIQSHVHW